jgi:hypothetical protein
MGKWKLLTTKFTTSPYHPLTNQFISSFCAKCIFNYDYYYTHYKTSNTTFIKSTHFTSSLSQHNKIWVDTNKIYCMPKTVYYIHTQIYVGEETEREGPKMISEITWLND